MKRLILLGASGSIGMQTIDVVHQHPADFAITAFSVGHHIEKIAEILKDSPVKNICVQEEKDAIALSAVYPDIHFVYGDEGLCWLSENCEYDLLVNALVGFVGFMPTLKAIESGHDVALANKETLVVGGKLIYEALHRCHRSLYPIDSEHSAIFQCLQGNRKEEVKRLIITASGGSFRTKSREELKDVTVAQALNHPNWTMGAKITIDSATMMNKGFEVTEAHWLFDMDYDHIDVLMHPESVVHSMVEYVDHSTIAQMGAPDMRLPIQYALTWPQRYPLAQEHPLDLAEIGSLHFSKPDVRRFPLLALAYEAGRKGGNLDAVMNGANEEANAAFRKGIISFLMIEEIVIRAVNLAPFKEVETVQDLIDGDAWGRNFALAQIERNRIK
ncbi:MAG: 1-deoxy-D-xylulose-5-phosphate reductoisomerase [Solobacterium sp.]|jgi:1-deoxy-D-xylulose-5-phosphate reductoisomerase|nr:1-deoxy-D-xylulose-5-phosphate reductoisomerase [Solobacterium sp.]MCH4204923.1 1-deoxy-D-xylulose-5-phosphate reductoisomerase [Solobacterium sp.]MCH4226315.1 1-deoxy-D-xylulose-5-phosphate reductoisomerase [Solobacterium sp.]MCH4281716.1 1-deoxy-D-xylulose-5-phosphate reductoisomerase [Solobacterium sp.]